MRGHNVVNTKTNVKEYEHQREAIRTNWLNKAIVNVRCLEPRFGVRPKSIGTRGVMQGVF